MFRVKISSVITSLIFRLAVFLFLIMAVIASGTYLLYQQIANQFNRSNIINIAGRQRMLSQKISKIVCEMEHRALEKEKQKKFIIDLENSIALWEKSHKELRSTKENSNEINKLFDSIDPYFQKILGASKNVDLAIKSDEPELFKNSVQIVLDNEGAFLQIMDEIVFKYDFETRARIENIARLQYLEYLAIIFLLVIITIFIINPIIRKLKSTFNSLNMFKMATENTSDHIIITDSDGRIIYANKGAENITGYSREEMIGKKSGSAELWGGLMDKEFYKRLWHTIKEEKLPFFGEIRNKKKDGREYYAEASISPVIGENKKIEFFVGIERDITEKKALNREKDEFVSMVSHNLRTPLTIIKWISERIVRKNNKDKESLQYIEDVNKSVNRLLEIVESLLSIRRFEEGKIKISPEEIDLVEFLKKCFKSYDYAFEKKNIKFSFLSDLESLKITTDKNILDNIFHCLMDNAISYTPGGGNIKVGLEKKNSTVIISVKDTGVGIPEEEQGNVFKRFFRASNASIFRPNGTGLGLFIAKLGTELLGGKIWFKSKLNQGATFYIELPQK